MPNAIRQLISSFTVTLVALGVYQLLAMFFPLVNHAQFYTFLGFFFVQEVFTGYLLRKFVGDRDKFIAVFFILTGARFLLAMIGSLAIIVLFPEKKDLLALSFCMLYLYYLATDTYIVGSNLKKRQEKEAN